MARPSDFVSEVRATANGLIEKVNQARALRREWDALDYGTTLPETAFTGEEPNAVSEHAGLDKDDIAAFFTSMDAVETLLSQGHASNYYRLR